MDPASAPRSVRWLAAIGIFARIVFVFTASTPAIFVVGTLFLGAFFRLLGISSFFEFVATNLRDHLGAIALSLLSLPLLGMLMEKRHVTIPLALVTGIAILIQQEELAGVSAVFGMPALFFLMGEEHLSRTAKRGLATTLTVLVSSAFAGLFIGVLLLALRNRFWT